MLIHLPTMRIGREWAKQIKIQPVRSRGQHKRAIRRLSGEVIDDDEDEDDDDV